MESQAKFEGWAVVEMMGHQREIGFVTTEYFGGAALFRVDTPEISERELTTTRPEYLDTDKGYRMCPAGTKIKRPAIPPKTRMVSPSALYAITPCTEKTARKAIEEAIPRRLILLDIPGTDARPDRAVIADTGRETQATWDYLNNVVNPALAKIDFKVERIPVLDRSGQVVLPTLWSGQGQLLIPAYESGLPKLSNFCSSHWKREVVKRWAIKEGLVPATNWLGISTDEMRRIATPRAQNWLLGYPLVYICPRSREGCVNEIEQFGWPPAPKSSCYICPNRRNDQWRDLRDNRPNEFAKACDEDRGLRLRNPNLYLHESCVPLDQADLGKDGDNAKQPTLGCDSGDCFV